MPPTPTPTSERDTLPTQKTTTKKQIEKEIKRKRRKKRKKTMLPVH